MTEESGAAPVGAATPNPWNPTSVAWLSLFLTPFAGFVLHTLNFRRLGLGHRTRMEAAKNLVGAFLFLLLVFSPRVPYQLTALLAIALAGYFRASQLPHFKRWSRLGSKPASIRQPIAYSVPGVIALVLVLIAVDMRLEERRYDRFQSLYEQGDYDRAAEVMEQQLRAFPEDPSPHWNIALIREELGDCDGAAEHLRLYLRALPHDDEAVQWLADLEAGACNGSIPLDPSAPADTADPTRISMPRALRSLGCGGCAASADTPSD